MNIIINKSKSIKRKKEKIKISNLNDFKQALHREGYKLDIINDKNFEEEISKIFTIDKNIIRKMYKCINDTEITYRAESISDFIDYIEQIDLFNQEHIKLCNKLKYINMLHINRVEYERVVSEKDNVDEIIKAINKIKDKISESLTEREYLYLEELERELDKNYIYTKDIELLKKMIINNNTEVEEEYNLKSQVKTIYVHMPKVISENYIKPTKGSVEYYYHIKANIPRMKRLRKNISKYINEVEGEKVFKIDQSSALQDSINIAVARYNNIEFKAISGSNEVLDYCTVVPMKEAEFKSSKVNKLGELGVGYNRINDSEKKILEEIHKLIIANEISDEGELILYSKWEPCPSCYYVISQFMNMYPKIKVKVKYKQKYSNKK